MRLDKFFCYAIYRTITRCTRLDMIAHQYGDRRLNDYFRELTSEIETINQ
jgi:hypothetical protein